jgi:hypothetical protein
VLELSTPTSVPDAPLEPRAQAPQLVSLGWALRRTALLLLMIFVMVVVGAWLFYAGIDPDEAAAGPSPSETASPKR